MSFLLAVPVIAIFTKFDALEDAAFGNLINEGISSEDAWKQAPARAIADFEKGYLGDLYGVRYPPKGHICLRGMVFYSRMS